MTKVKIFKFEVSNSSSNKLDGDESKPWFKSSLNKLVSAQQIEDTINNFIKDNVDVLVDIKVNNIDENYHNNARGNKISLLYTLTYIKVGE